VVQQARHALASLMPPWLNRAYGRSFTTEGIFTIYDFDAAIMRDALLARYPTYAPEDALPYIARDRRIRRGPHESSDAIRKRLIQWIDIWQLSGLPFGLLLSVQGFLAPWYPPVRLVTRRGLWYTLAEGTVGRMLRLQGYEAIPPCPYELGPSWPTGAPPQGEPERARAAGLFTRHKAPSPNWDWDSISNPENAERWWHSWLIVYPPRYPLVGNYDAGILYDNPDLTWGFDEPSGTFTTFKAIIKDHKAERSRCVAVVFPPSLDDFPPTADVDDPGMPDGYWGWEVKLEGGEWVNARRDDCRFLFLGENE
jgi:hypothetical protein